MILTPQNVEKMQYVNEVSISIAVTDVISPNEDRTTSCAKPEEIAIAVQWFNEA